MPKKTPPPAPETAAQTTATPVDPTLEMLPSDRALYDDKAKFVGKLDTTVYGKALREWVPPHLSNDVVAWVTAFPGLAQVTVVRRKRAADKAAAEEVLAETGRRAKEMSLVIELAAVRHPELIRMLEPKLGRTEAEHLTNLLGMRSRLDLKADYLRSGNITLKLDAGHSTAAVAAQATAHRAAEAQIKTLDDQGGVELAALEKAREQAPALQTRLNKFLLALCNGDRAAAHLLGFQERSRSRPADPQPQPAPPPAPAPEPEPAPDATSTSSASPEKPAPASPTPSAGATPTTPPPNMEPPVPPPPSP